MATYTTTEPKQKHQPGRVARNRAAVAGMFFINGAIFANWAARIPAVQTRIGLNEQSLGLALLGLSVGVLLALPLAGGLIARFSSRTVTGVGAVGIAVVLPFLGIAGSFWALWLTLFAFGVSTSLMDVAMNAQAVEVEQRHGKPIMSSFHAAFSIGSAAGAGIGALFAGRGFIPVQHFIVVAILFGVLAVLAARWLVNVPGEQDSSETVFTLPPQALWTLGVVAFCAAIGEGAMADWSALYLRRIVGVGAGLAGLGFAAFSLAMTVGRLTGDWLTAKFNPVWVVRGGGLLAATGMGLALVFPVYRRRHRWHAADRAGAIDGDSAGV